jgi:hypothetical protein
MMALNEAMVRQRAAPALDPREPPPQILKDVFKRFQKLPASAIATESHILDFEKDMSSHGVEKTRSISLQTLKSIYKRFLGNENSFDVDVFEDQPVYTSEALPGRSTFCHINSFTLQWLSLLLSCGPYTSAIT